MMWFLKNFISLSARERLKQAIKKADIYSNNDPIDFRGLISDPLEGLERANGYPILMNFDGEQCRGMKVLSFPLKKNENHPYILTALEYMNGEAIDFNSSSLVKFYQLFQPKNAAEVLGLYLSEVPAILGENVRVLKLPWAGVPHKKDIKNRKNTPINEAKEFNMKLTWKDGDAQFGPVSQRKGEFEFYRIKTLVDSISKNGYQPGQHIPGILLVKNDDFRILVRTGNHRSAVLAAFDDTKIPVVLYPQEIVRRDEVDHWPAVKQGAFSKEVALKIFDRIFTGQQPPALKLVWPAS